MNIFGAFTSNIQTSTGHIFLHVKIWQLKFSQCFKITLQKLMKTGVHWVGGEGALQHIERSNWVAYVLWQINSKIQADLSFILFDYMKDKFLHYERAAFLFLTVQRNQAISAIKIATQKAGLSSHEVTSRFGEISPTSVERRFSIKGQNLFWNRWKT